MPSHQGKLPKTWKNGPEYAMVGTIHANPCAYKKVDQQCWSTSKPSTMLVIMVKMVNFNEWSGQCRRPRHRKCW
ncbi:MAG TPA: hypothetical protein VFS88_04190, partial [Micavibrio sp.]|nr:hypothetical protein [Micavibrio sp.]